MLRRRPLLGILTYSFSVSKVGIKEKRKREKEGRQEREREKKGRKIKKEGPLQRLQVVTKKLILFFFWCVCV